MFAYNGPGKGFKLPEILTEEEQAALLAVPKLRYPTALRNYSMVLTMLDCGLRSSEIVKLKPNDVDLRTGKVKVNQGKSRKDRHLWAGERTLDALRRWIERRAKLSIGSDVLYCTLEGNQ